MRDERHPRRVAMAALARRQHGVVAVFQLREMGFSRSQVARLERRATLHRLHRGVYAVGHLKLTTRGRCMAAVLAGGPGALLSHRAAAALWDLRPIPGGRIDVTARGRGRKRRAAIRIHTARHLAPEDRSERDGIPVTSQYRTLLDLAAVAPYQQLRLALEAGERQDLLDGRALDRMLARSNGHRGRGRLQTALGELRGPAPWTQSQLENQFLALVRRARLPEPALNVMVAGVLVDCFWPRERLVVELDGYAWHRGRRRFEQDRRNDVRLQLAGCRCVRVTQRRVQREASQLVGELTALLSVGRAAGP